jgi:SAM-dependent methyltransferase
MLGKKPEFDAIANEFNDMVYKSLGAFGKYETAIIRYKSEYLKYILPHPPPPLPDKINILEFGCGIGRNMPYIKEFFPGAEIFGCDISEESVKRARMDFPDCHFDTIYDRKDLEMYNGKIDCVFISCVLHHIPHKEHKIWIKELFRIMKKGAYIIVFEMNRYNPIAKRFTEKCALDVNAVFLKPAYCKKLIFDIFGSAHLGYTFFFPWRNKVFTAIEHALFWLPLGAQYYVAGEKS